MIVVVEEMGVGEEGWDKCEERGKMKRTISSYRAILGKKASKMRMGVTNDIHSLESTFGRHSFYFVVDGCN